MLYKILKKKWFAIDESRGSKCLGSLAKIIDILHRGSVDVLCITKTIQRVI